MSVAVVDSNVLIGYANRRDQDHDRAVAIMDGIDAGTLPTVRLTNYVIAEATSYIHERQRHAVAVDLYDRLKAGAAFEFVHASKAEFVRADELFHTYDQLSFVDATIVATMQRRDLNVIYSFDSDFDAVPNVTRLETADDPFG